MSPRPLYLVSCVKTKAAAPCPAGDLYVSDWFLKARAYVEAAGGDWRILSAEHGLVDPLQILAPYETTLLRMAKPARQAWAERVLGQLDAGGLADRPVVMLAGRLYREFLEGSLLRCDVPLRGLGLGEQKARLAELARRARQGAA